MINKRINNVEGTLEKVAKKAIFTMGLPASGKSSSIKKLFDLSQFTVIDPDEIKKEKIDYNPKEPQVYHEWSKVEAKKRQNEAVASSKSIIVDGTATNTEKMYVNIKSLQAMGYYVELLYIRTSLKTAIERNAKRERNVPEKIIHEKYNLINVSLEILSNVVDKITIIDND